MNNLSKFLIGAATVSMVVMAQSCSSSNDEGKIGIVAHRGYWNCEEAGFARNSVAALKCAQEAGYWGSEFDVNMTSDEVLLVYHDSKIDGKVIDQTPASEFKDVRLSNGEPIPTIDQYLEQGKKYPKTKLVYELKPHSTPEIENRLVDITLEKLKKYGLNSPKRVMFISFSINICKRLAELAPEYTVQYLGSDYSPADLASFKINGVDFHYNVFYKNPDWLESARENSMSVNVWTVNNKADMEKMIGMGVDMITTDHPEEVRALLGENELSFSKK